MGTQIFTKYNITVKHFETVNSSALQRMTGFNKSMNDWMNKFIRLKTLLNIRKRNHTHRFNTIKIIINGYLNNAYPKYHNFKQAHDA